jgi:lipid-A-disaccharide synthase
MKPAFSFLAYLRNSLAMSFPHIFLIAGESSGDLLGSRLMRALRNKAPDIRFSGIGGPMMAKEGLTSIFPMEELSLHGVTEVIRHIPNIRRRIAQTVSKIAEAQPDVLVTIDAPGFSLRVSRQLKGQGIPLLHYVAPTVWAWKAGRAKKVSDYLDHLFTLFDFEPPYFTRHGLAATFVGHPLTEGSEYPVALSVRSAAREQLQLKDGELLLAVMPGSRKSEINRLLPLFGEILEPLKDKFPNLRLAIPVVDHVSSDVKRLTSLWGNQPILLDQDGGKELIFAAADVSLACSGTILMELAWARIPTVVAYKTSWLTGVILRSSLKIKYASMINIIADRLIQPEFLQREMTSEGIERELSFLLNDPTAREAQIAAVEPILDRLQHPGETPSNRAAEVILGYCRP